MLSGEFSENKVALLSVMPGLREHVDLRSAVPENVPSVLHESALRAGLQHIR